MIYIFSSFEFNKYISGTHNKYFEATQIMSFQFKLIHEGLTQ